MTTNFIVSTTIQPPTEATHKFIEFANRHGWLFVMVGDKKTPDDAYHALAAINRQFVYFSCVAQETMYPEVSEAIGWNCIQRRNLGLLYALECGAEIIATVDDDNIPYDDWGQRIYVGNMLTCPQYWQNDQGNLPRVFDPLSATSHPELWHRGYPLECRETRHRIDCVEGCSKILVQANLWDGDPDIDAVARIANGPLVSFDRRGPFVSVDLCPFNSQNTFLHRSVVPHYMVLPHVGRVDDIWGAYLMQAILLREGKSHFVAFDDATVRQDRNKQNLVRNLEKEIFGYDNGLRFARACVDRSSPIEEVLGLLPKKARLAFDIYSKTASKLLSKRTEHQETT